MNRKLRVIILTMVLTVLMFGGTRLMAQDNLDVNTTEASQTETPKDEGKVEPMAKEGEEGESSVEEVNNADIDGNEANDDVTGETETTKPEAKENENTEVNKTETTEGKPEAKQEEKKTEAKGDANGEKADTTKESGETKAEEGKDDDAQKSLEENKESAKGNGAEDGAPAKAPAKAGDPATEGEGTEPKEDVDDGKPTKPVNKKDQIDKNADEKLKAQEEKINAEKDPEAKKKLQAEYNKMYFDALKESGKEKLDDAILDRFTDKYRTKEYYELKEEYQKLQAKAKEGKLTQEELDAFNNKLGTFDPPRILDNDEKAAYDKLSATPYIPGIADNSDQNAQNLYNAYKEAKDALEAALNPENPRTTDDKGLQDLVDAFKKAETDLTEAIKDGKVNPKYTEGSPEISIFPLDNNGKVGKELDKDTYYIPDATDFKLLFQVNKDKETEGKTFRFTIKNLKDVGDVSVPEASLSNLVFLNKTPVHLQKDEKTGEYYFETTADQNFGIAQLKFNMNGFRAAFHEGFELTLEGTDAKKVTKKFLITKKGYEDYTDVDGIGSHEKDNPQKDVDAGKTQDGIVDGNTDKVFDFFTMLKKSDAYIDKVLVNSPNGDSLPLSSVEITITAPQNFDGNFADFIHKSGLNYHDNGNGTYTLKLDLEKFKADDKFKVEDGKLKYNNEEITNKNITNAILEAGKDKKYIDENDQEHVVTTTTVLEGTLGEGENAVIYQVRLSDDKHQVKSLWKKNADGSYEKLGDFKDGKVTTKEGKTFKLLGNELISYTKETDVYEGNVSNKTENGKTEADPTVTPTFEGNQVTVETEEKNSDGTTIKKTSYGGTIVEDKFFQKIGENEYKYLIDQTDLTFAYIDDNGKMYTSQNADGTLKPVYNKVFKKVIKADGTEEYYIVEGLEYKEGLNLIDKFGRLMKDIKVTEEGGQYTFTHSKKKDKDGKEAKVTTETSKDGRTIHVDTSNKPIFVNNKNYVEKNDPEIFESIIGKYYYDKDNKVFVKADKENVIGDKFYDGLTRGSLVRKLVEIYTKDKKDYIVPKNTTRYYGSTNKSDYYEHDNRVYVKKGKDKDTYLMSADGKEAKVIAPFDIQKVIQILGTGNKEKQIITDEKNIFDAVQNAKFAFRFPGFLAGKNVVYNVHADVKATYMQPKLGNEGQFEEKSIFNNGDVNETKTVDKYFTLKIKENKKAKFFKDAPKEFKDIPNYNFFNIFYRDSDYIERDQLLKPLLEAKTKYDALSEDEKKKADEATKKQLAILDNIQNELKERFDGAQFVLDNGKVVIKDRKGNVVELDRTLLWEIGFNNEDGVLFPEDRDTSIVVEDYNMDNRLVYDEIIINDTVEKWNEAKKSAEDQGKEFKGTDQYFFLDQLANIRLGVSRGYVDGNFIAVGPDFKITREQIEEALGYNTEDVTDDKTEEELTLGLEGKKFKVKLTRDTDKGQIRIKVIKAFYQKNNEYSEDNKDKNNKFYSPVQEAYKKQLEDFEKHAKDFKVVEGKDAQATKDAFKTSFEEFIKKTYKETTDCYGTLTHMFNELLENVKTEGQTVDQVKQELDKIKNKMSEEMGKMALAYLDPSKGTYKFDDMRFNAIRVELKPNITIGGAITPQKTKKFGITSVIVPDVEIPYTDEFGKPLTNKDMYVNKEVRDILANGITTGEGASKKTTKYEAKDLMNEEKFIKIMTEAYKRVNDAITAGTIKIVELVEFKDGKYTAKKGGDLKVKDLAIDGKPLENKKGGVINPWYILTEKDGIKSLEDLAGSADDDTKAAIAKLKEKEIDLIGYYMLEQGYNRAFFKNFAQYKLPKQEQGPGIFGEDNNWKHKLCHPGPIGQCIESAGEDKTQESDGNKDKDEAGFKNDAEITIDYPSTDDTPDEEHPKVDKKSDKTDAVDISEKDKDGKEKDQKIDFTIDVSVNQMTKTDKDLYDIKQGKTPSTKPEDYENGHYKYKKDTLIMDILPNIFKLANGTELNLTVHDEALKKGGVNAEIFKDKNAVNAWKKGIEYKYVEDLEAYLGTLSGDRKKVLQKAYDEAIKEGRIKKGEKVQAVLAWLPEFVAPSGSEKHFTFELKNVLVDKKEFKDYFDNGHGETYTNHAAFGDKGQVYFASTDVTIKKDKSGTVDKFLRIYDKDGNPVNEGNEKEWFEGNAELKFGDKFDYKLRYNNHIPTQETGKTGLMVSEFNIADEFNDAKDGLRPVLNGFVKVQEGYEGKYTIKYTINGIGYTEKEIKEKGLKLKDVTKISIATEKDRLASGDHRDFILPMMVPNLDAKIEDGKVFYIGTDGEKHELGKAEDFFNLKDLVKPGTDLSFDNKSEDSNTVTVYLEKERFIKVFKEFLDRNGEKLKDLNNLEAKFDIYQIIEENGVKKRVKVGELKANKDNNFTDMLDHLPIFKKTTTVDKDGTVKVDVVNYEYELEETAMPGFESKVYKLDDSDKLGFVWQATNTEKPEEPEYPGDNPKKEHKKVTVTIRVNKTWEVLNNGSTPSIQVELYANGKATGKVFTLGDGNWSAVFENLPSKDDDGNEIKYTVVEVGSANGITMIEDRKFEVIYSTNADGSITILNKEVPNEEEKDKKEPKKEEPHDDENDRDRDQGKNKLPKTGVAEDLGAIYFAFVLLLGLVFIKKRYLVK